MKSTVGTRGYMAPEIDGITNYSLKADLYSIGVILLEMLVGNLPWRNKTPYADKQNFFLNLRVGNVIFDQLGVRLSPFSKDILFGLLQPNPQYRMDINWLVE